MKLETLLKACDIWNKLTHPWEPLTEDRHATRRARAKRIWSKYLRPNRTKLGCLSNGSVFVKYPEEV